MRYGYVDKPGGGFEKYINRVNVYIRIIGNWRLEGEDYRLYQTKQTWKQRHFKMHTYPADPELDVTLEVGSINLPSASRRAGEEAPSRSTTPGTSGHPTPGPEPEDPQLLNEPHPDPDAKARHASLLAYFKEEERHHHHTARQAKAFGLNYCQNFLKLEGGELVKEIPKGSLHCKICDKDFSSTQKLKEHVRRHHTLDNKFQCSICQKRLGDSVSLKNHLRDVHKQGEDKAKEPKLYKCEKCAKKGKKFETYVVSRANTHKRECGKKFSCPHCGKDYSQSRTRDLHRDKECPKRPGAKDTPPAVCPVCKKQFRARRSLPRHVRTQHPDYDGPLSYDLPEEEQEEQEQEEDQD